MNLTLDIGNTRIKWALFEGENLREHGTVDAEKVEQLCALPWRQAAVCASGHACLGKLEATGRPLLRLSHTTPMPITLDYATPSTLGPDRIAAACGAWKLMGGKNCVIIDAGTCITIDFLDCHGCYHGGAILPGVDMKFHALHTFTAQLPLLENVDGHGSIVTGRSTAESITAGVLTATRFAVEGFLRHYRAAYGPVAVLLSGGDAPRLVAEPTPLLQTAQILPHIVLTGLNTILNENEK